MKIFLISLGIINIALLLFLARNWRGLPTAGRIAMGGLIFVAMPCAYSFGVVMDGMTSMTSVQFCGSCHIMDSYVKSLEVDNEESLPAIHYQNNWVPQKTACYDCHRQYSMFGDVKAKMNGLMHVYVNYFGTPSDPIKLYQPYRNDDCMHCHAPAKKFQANEDHIDNMEDMKSGETPCMDCHDVVHVTE